jgi:hypothetical protein
MVLRTDAGSWRSQDALRLPGSTATWVAGHYPRLTYQPPLNLCLANISHLSIGLAAPHAAWPRAAEIRFRLQTNGHPDQRDFFIPLQVDGQLHTYTYDLKLLELHDDTRLVGLQIRPLAVANPKRAYPVRVGPIRLIHDASPITCGTI